MGGLNLYMGNSGFLRRRLLPINQSTDTYSPSSISTTAFTAEHRIRLLDATLDGLGASVVSLDALDWSLQSKSVLERSPGVKGTIRLTLAPMLLSVYNLVLTKTTTHQHHNMSIFDIPTFEAESETSPLPLEQANYRYES